MKKAICELESVSPYSQSKYHNTDKLDKENHGDYEKRTWRERMHVTDEGYVFIPPMVFANSIKEAAKFLALQIPGKGKSRYTKHFEAGVMVTEPLHLGIKKEDVYGEWVFVPSDGKRGGTTRVEKCFPLIKKWKGEVTYLILDDTITKEVFEKVLRGCGQFIGIGRFRPRNWGYYGRFKINKITWQ